MCCLFMLMQLKDYQTRNMGANLWSVAVASVASCACYMFARILRIRYVVVSVFYCCNCPVCCPFERQRKVGGRMRCAGHNNNLCPVTSCHISCMINELISAHSAHNIPRLFCRKTGAHPPISTMENRLDKDCQRDSREGDRDRGVVNWQLDWGTNQHNWWL